MWNEVGMAVGRERSNVTTSGPGGQRACPVSSVGRPG